MPEQYLLRRKPIAWHFRLNIFRWRQGCMLNNVIHAAVMRDAQTMQESLQSSPLIADPSAPQVELDMQMADLAKNTLQYEALLTAQGKLMGLAETAISEGKM